MAAQTRHDDQNQAEASYRDRIHTILAERIRVEGQPFFDHLFPHHPEMNPSISTARDHGGIWQTQVERNVGLETAKSMDTGVVMVANADWNTIIALGAAYRIAPVSFFHHARRVRKSATYREIGLDGRSQYRISGLEEARAPCEGCWHLDCEPWGKFRAVDFQTTDLPRGAEDTIYRPSIDYSDLTDHIRLSFIRLKIDLYLVLIDGNTPFRFWFPGMSFLNRLPESLPEAASSLNEPQFSFEELVRGFFTYPSNRAMLNSISKVLSGDTTPGTLAASNPDAKRVALGALCWLFSLATLKVTTELVELQVTSLSYDAIDKPSMNTLALLSNCRKAVQQLRDLITSRDRSSSSSARSWAEQTFKEIEQKPGFVTKSNGVYNLSPESQMTYFKEARMDGFTKSLDGSFQLLIGAITVMDSDANKKQAERSTMLTLMAAIYLPLSLATSVFGMNIRELSGSTPWWAVVVAIAVVFFPSAAFLVYLFTKEKVTRWRSRQENEV